MPWYDPMITIDGIGQLTRDPDIEEWLRSDEITTGYFTGTKVRFVLEDIESDPAPEDFAAAVGNFLALGKADRDAAAPYVYANYREFVDAIDEDEWGFTKMEIWSHVKPSFIHVIRNAQGDGKVYVVITAECDWEIEHGLQLVYREAKRLNRVSAQDGGLTDSDSDLDAPRGFFNAIRRLFSGRRR
jgi:hypothetical protein